MTIAWDLAHFEVKVLFFSLEYYLLHILYGDVVLTVAFGLPLSECKDICKEVPPVGAHHWLELGALRAHLPREELGKGLPDDWGQAGPSSRLQGQDSCKELTIIIIIAIIRFIKKNIEAILIYLQK